MSYRRSSPLRHWHGERRAAITLLAEAHAGLGEHGGRRGRPLEVGRPVAHAYVLRIVAEFQGFTRDLHDLASEQTIVLAKADPRFRPLLTGMAIEGRWIDRGNADLASIQRDFKRIGILDVGAQIAARNSWWSARGDRTGDKSRFAGLIRLRNALAHGNQTQVDALRLGGILDTVSWTRAQIPVMNRLSGSLDRVVWNHLRQTFDQEPW